MSELERLTKSVRSELSVKPEIFGAKATFTLTNAGEIDGAEVVQVYIHDLAPTVERPEHELAGFMKVYLRPGESKVVSVNLDVSGRALFHPAILGKFHG